MQTIRRPLDEARRQRWRRTASRLPAGGLLAGRLLAGRLLAGRLPAGGLPAGGLPAGGLLAGRLLAGGFLLAAAWAPAQAEPLPLPAADFALTANLPRGGMLDLAHSNGRMRLEMSKPELPGTVIGLIDVKSRRMVMMMPNLPNMAVEIEVPPEYAAGAMVGTGSRAGRSEVAGEACDLWQVDPAAGSPVTSSVACITADGIALRTEIEVKGARHVLYEAIRLSRAPQEPRLFQVPPGVQVVKVPKGKLGGLLKLPGFGGAPAGSAPPAKPE